ncbi:hypothetical protein BCR32DRAFT_306312, partial [Anaeromyces robustus]
TNRVFNNVNNSYIDQYCDKIVSIFTEFLYGNKLAKDALMELDNITKIYFVTIKSLTGTIMLALLISLACLLLFLFIFLTKKKFKEKFSFFSSDLWFIYCLGYIMMLSSEFFYFEELSDLKCNLRFSLLHIGMNLWLIPILYKLLICFPEKNKYSEYLIIHKNKFIFICIGIEVVLNLLLSITPYTKEVKIFGNTIINKNFSQCTMKSIFGNIVIFIDIMIKVFIVLCIMLLSFIEWNVKEIYEDVRAIAINQYISSFSMALLIVLDYIKINNYNIIFIFHSSIIIFVCIFNYLFIYSIRLLFIRSKIIEKDGVNIRSSISSKSEKNFSSKTQGTGIISQLISYHYKNYSIETGDVVVSTTNSFMAQLI